MTVEELLAGKGVDYPHPGVNVTFKRAQRALPEPARQIALPVSSPQDSAAEMLVDMTPHPGKKKSPKKRR
jgi:hypothetical protein